MRVPRNVASFDHLASDGVIRVCGVHGRTGRVQNEIGTDLHLLAAPARKVGHDGGRGVCPDADDSPREQIQPSGAHFTVEPAGNVRRQPVTVHFP